MNRELTVSSPICFATQAQIPLNILKKMEYNSYIKIYETDIKNIEIIKINCYLLIEKNNITSIKGCVFYEEIIAII